MPEETKWTEGGDNVNKCQKL